MTADPILALALGSWIALLFVLERIRAAEPAPPGAGRRLLRNGAMALIAMAAAPFLLALVGTIAGRFEPAVDLHPLGPVGALAVQLVALDIWTYWMHRAYHRVPLLWRFHGPHHLDRHLDTTSALRFHVGEIAISATARLIPAILLGMSPATLLLFEAILTANAVFHHSNIALPPKLEKALSRLIVTPSIHWVHHHRKRADTDSNYTAILSVWDRLFGSANPRPRTPGMAIGAEGEEERSLRGVLLYPFERRS